MNLIRWERRTRFSRLCRPKAWGLYWGRAEVPIARDCLEFASAFRPSRRLLDTILIEMSRSSGMTSVTSTIARSWAARLWSAGSQP